VHSILTDWLMANPMSANRNPSKSQSHAILNSWKEIAAYLGRGVRNSPALGTGTAASGASHWQGEAQPCFCRRFGTEILDGNLGWEERL
jgi:hypothetical protein